MVNLQYIFSGDGAQIFIKGKILLHYRNKVRTIWNLIHKKKPYGIRSTPESDPH